MLESRRWQVKRQAAAASASTKVGVSARIELTKLLDRKVHLFLHVKVQEKWDEKRDFYKAWGLEYEV